MPQVQVLELDDDSIQLTKKDLEDLKVAATALEIEENSPEGDRLKLSDAGSQHTQTPSRALSENAFSENSMKRIA